MTAGSLGVLSRRFSIKSFKGVAHTLRRQAGMVLYVAGVISGVLGPLAGPLSIRKVLVRISAFNLLPATTVPAPVEPIFES